MVTSVKKRYLSGIFVILSSFSFVVLAAAPTTGFGGVFARIADNLLPLRNVLSAACYIIGIGFALAGLMALKAHKDNPQSNPLGKGLVAILVGALLLFLPQVLDTASETLFGSVSKNKGVTSSADSGFGM